MIPGPHLGSPAVGSPDPLLCSQDPSLCKTDAPAGSPGPQDRWALGTAFFGLCFLGGAKSHSGHFNSGDGKCYSKSMCDLIEMQRRTNRPVMGTWTVMAGRPQKLARKVLLLPQALFSGMPLLTFLLPISWGRGHSGSGPRPPHLAGAGGAFIPSVRNQSRGKHGARCVHMKTETLFY